jgi:hypothetical protein
MFATSAVEKINRAANLDALLSPETRKAVEEDATRDPVTTALAEKMSEFLPASLKPFCNCDSREAERLAFDLIESVSGSIQLIEALGEGLPTNSKIPGMRQALQNFSEALDDITLRLHPDQAGIEQAQESCRELVDVLEGLKQPDASTGSFLPPNSDSPAPTMPDIPLEQSIPEKAESPEILSIAERQLEMARAMDESIGVSRSNYSLSPEPKRRGPDR